MTGDAPDIPHPEPLRYGERVGKPIIEFIDVRKTLGGRAVLNGLNLTVRAGETLAIIGRSGTGKSTALKLAVGLLKPDSGTIRVDGIDVTGGNQKDLEAARRKIGFLFQNAALLNDLTVFENVALPLRELDEMPRDRIEEIVAGKLREVAMEHKRESMPLPLSGGEKKRVGLARALVRDPKILLYDEPTTGLDPDLAGQIDRLIKQMQKKLCVTSLVVTHDMDTAMWVADRIALLHEGRILEEGRPREMVQSPNSVVKAFLSERHRTAESEPLVTPEE